MNFQTGKYFESPDGLGGGGFCKELEETTSRNTWHFARRSKYNFLFHKAKAALCWTLNLQMNLVWLVVTYKNFQLAL